MRRQQTRLKCLSVQDLQAHHESAWQMTCQELHAKKNQVGLFEELKSTNETRCMSAIGQPVTNLHKHHVLLVKTPALL